MRWWLAVKVGARCRLTSGGGLAGIDVADNDDVDVKLLLTAEERYVSDKDNRDVKCVLRRWGQGRADV
jgi:hypothetical protein